MTGGDGVEAVIGCGRFLVRADMGSNCVVALAIIFILCKMRVLCSSIAAIARSAVAIVTAMDPSRLVYPCDIVNLLVDNFFLFCYLERANWVLIDVKLRGVML